MVRRVGWKFEVRYDAHELSRQAPIFNCSGRRIVSSFLHLHLMQSQQETYYTPAPDHLPTGHGLLCLTETREKLGGVTAICMGWI